MLENRFVSSSDADGDRVSVTNTQYSSSPAARHLNVIARPDNSIAFKKERS
jgi:hypothetical protein